MPLLVLLPPQLAQFVRGRLVPPMWLPRDEIAARERPVSARSAP